MRILLAPLLLSVVVGTAAAQPARIPRLVFPLVGHARYHDDFGEPRGHLKHQGIDILAARKAIAVAAEPGTIEFWTTSKSAGCMLYLRGASGTTYQYIHLNNDLGRGNDNRGKCVAGVAYAPGLGDGAAVLAGQHIGFVGDSGDANGLHPHLHFEVHPGGGAAVDPFRFLNRAQHLFFSATPGSTVSLSLGGTVLAADGKTLSLHVETLHVLPSGGALTNVGRTVTLRTADVVAMPQGNELVGATVIVLTEPLVTSLSTQLGKGWSLASVALAG